MEVGKIRVPVNGGFLLAGRNEGTDCDGIYIMFETDDGDIIDIVTTECRIQIKEKLTFILTLMSILIIIHHKAPLTLIRFMMHLVKRGNRTRR